MNAPTAFTTIRSAATCNTRKSCCPSHLDGAGSQLDWARDRSRLWNAVERSEPRANARVAREYVLALPARAQWRAAYCSGADLCPRKSPDRYHNAVDLAIHQPRTDPRNFHAHLLSTTREVTASGFGPKTIAELSGSARFEQGAGLGRCRNTPRSASVGPHMSNEALRAAGLEARISHVPDSESILRPQARAWLPRVAWELEQRGEHSVLGRSRGVSSSHKSVKRRSSIPWAAPDFAAGARKTPEEIRRQAIEDWARDSGAIGPQRITAGRGD